MFETGQVGRTGSILFLDGIHLFSMFELFVYISLGPRRPPGTKVIGVSKPNLQWIHSFTEGKKNVAKSPKLWYYLDISSYKPLPSLFS